MTTTSIIYYELLRSSVNNRNMNKHTLSKYNYENIEITRWLFIGTHEVT